jgi:hypothetical protein
MIFFQYVLFDLISIEFHHFYYLIDLNMKEYIQVIFDHQVIVVEFQKINFFHELN